MTVARAALAVLALMPALQAVAAPPRRITITSEPAEVELVSGARAVLRITAPETPVLTASVGRVETARALGNGTFEAVYLPPRETYPQVAIIVASTPRDYGWLALPLDGTGEVSVRPDASGMATVTIGNRRFGPQKPGPDGKANIRIVVPPGAKYASAGGKRLSLRTPDVAHVFAVAEPAPGEERTYLVRVFAVTPDGKRRRGAPVQLAVSVGDITRPREVEPGTFEARWTLPRGATAPATVEAKLRDELASWKASLSTTAAPPAPPTAGPPVTPVAPEVGRARRLRLDVERSTVTAGDETVDFTLAVDDGAGNPIDDANPRVSINVGAFLGWTRGAPGRWIGHVSVPTRIQGEAKLVIVVTAGDLMASREVTVRPGPTAEVMVDSSGKAADGAPITYTITTVDRFGNPTDDAPPEVTAQRGTVEKPVRQRVGVYRAVYHPPASAPAGRDEVTVRAGRVQRVAAVLLEEPVPGHLGVAAKGGIARRSGAVGPVGSGDVVAWTGIADGRLGLQLDGSWFRFSEKLPLLGGTGSTTQTYLKFTLEPVWRQPLGRSVTLWASAGAGATRVQSSSQLPNQPSVDETRWVFTASGAAAIGWKLGFGYPFLELRAAWIADPKLATLTGAFTPIFVQAGYRFDAL